MKKLIRLALATIILTACMPDAPHKQISEEFRALQKFCSSGIEDFSKISNSIHSRRWSCDMSLSYKDWEIQFKSEVSKRGWYSIATNDQSNLMCNKQYEQVSLNYFQHNISTSEKWKYGFSIRYPATKCKSAPN
jgi:hypothetical protein